jgi:hypothetical protein
VTGQRIVETTQHGKINLTAVPSGSTSSLTVFQANGTSFVIPTAVMHCVGTELDPLLFDLDALQHAEATTPGQVPVQVRWRGAAAPSLPWLLRPMTVTPGVTDGMVSTTSGPTLETALSTCAPPGVTKLSLAGTPPASPPATRGLRLYTLTVKGINASGAPDTGDMASFMNVDDFRNPGLGLMESWYHGVFKVSVTNGHYGMVGVFVHSSKGIQEQRLAMINFTVHGDTTVTVDARTATARVSVATPLPTDVGSGFVSWQREGTPVNVGGGVFFSGEIGVESLWQIGDGAPPFAVYVSPISKPSIGTQGLATNFHLDSPSTDAHAYSYDLAFGDFGAISSQQRHKVTAAQLATVATRYFSNVPIPSMYEARMSSFTWQAGGGGFYDQISAPLDRTEYVTGAADLLWTQEVQADTQMFAGISLDSDRVFMPGEAVAADWNRGPIGPGVAVDTGRVPAGTVQGCPACTEMGALEFSIYPFGDNPAGRYGLPNFSGAGITETDAYTLLRNGATISTGQDPLGVVVPVAPGGARYQLQYSVAMAAPWWTLSTNATTTWSFSTPRLTNGPLPPGWVCFSGTSVGCSVVALMLPDYELPEDDLGRVASGPVTFELGISHILGVSIAVTSAHVSVSFNGGTIWAPAHVTPNGTNAFAVSYVNPSQAGTVAFRIHVTDADGGVLDQTILNAYAIP